MLVWELTAQEASRKGNWATASLLRCLAAGVSSGMVAQAGWRLFQGFLWKAPLCSILSEEAVLWKNLCSPQTISAVVISHPFSCVMWAHQGWTSASKQEREGKLLQRPLNSYYDTLILFLAAFVLAWCVFSDRDERGWVDGKERSHSFRKGFLFKEKTLNVRIPDLLCYLFL